MVLVSPRRVGLGFGALAVLSNVTELGGIPIATKLSSTVWVRLEVS